MKIICSASRYDFRNPSPVNDIAVIKLSQLVFPTLGDPLERCTRDYFNPKYPKTIQVQIHYEYLKLIMNLILHKLLSNIKKSILGSRKRFELHLFRSCIFCFKKN